MYVTTSLNMRSGPSAEYPVIRSLAYNSELETISKFDNGWYHINYGGIKGYVSGKYYQIRKLLQSQLQNLQASQQLNQQLNQQLSLRTNQHLQNIVL